MVSVLKCVSPQKLLLNKLSSADKKMMVDKFKCPIRGACKTHDLHGPQVGKLYKVCSCQKTVRCGCKVMP